MIAKLSGKVDSIDLDHTVLDVGGVGYLVYASSRTLSQLAENHPATLLTETVMRQEQPFLYGFLTTADRQWFRLLVTVQGVGARMALSIQSVLSTSEISQAIVLQDKQAFARADGVGAKLASRIVAELKDKVGGLTVTGQPSVAYVMPTTTAISQALSALVNLGYRQADVSQAVNQLVTTHGENVEVEVLIREGLALLSAPAFSAKSRP